MTWALKRQAMFLVIFLALFGGLLFWVSYPIFHQTPSCVDNTQNGLETGIDCGGTCPNACATQVDPVSIIWARVFRVVSTRYNAVAYLENHNATVAVRKIKYRFRFADKDNIYIGKRDGVTYIPPSQKFAIFEPAIDIGNSVPVYTTFEFTEEPVWTEVPPDKISQSKVFATDTVLTDEDTSPKLFATIKNNSLFTIPEISVVAILYDEAGNALSASRTYIDVLNKETSKDVSFTWPEPFGKKVVVKEILPIFNTFLAELR